MADSTPENAPAGNASTWNAPAGEQNFPAREEGVSLPQSGQGSKVVEIHAGLDDHVVWGTVSCSDACSVSAFVFGYMDDQFSDCILHLICTEYLEQGQDGSNPSKTQAKEERPRPGEGEVTSEQEDPESVKGPALCSIPASSLLLASQSPVFRSMFSTAFREGVATKKADIQLTAAEAKLFKEMIHFIYHSSLSPGLTGNLEDLTTLLLLSDRFIVSPLTSLCIGELSQLSLSLTLQQALHLISLPTVLQNNTEYQKVLAAARAFVRKTYSKALRAPTSTTELEMVRQLPQPGIELLLESSSLEVNSEDYVLWTALTWVEAKGDSPRHQLELLIRVVLPRIRAPFLSLKGVLALKQKVTSLLETVSPGQASDKASQADAASLEGCSRSAPEMPNSAGHFLATYELALLLDCLQAAAGLPFSIPNLLRAEAKLMMPRKGYRPPDATMSFNPMPLKDCRQLRIQYSGSAPRVGENPRWESTAAAWGRHVWAALFLEKNVLLPKLLCILDLLSFSPTEGKKKNLLVRTALWVKVRGSYQQMSPFRFSCDASAATIGSGKIHVRELLDTPWSIALTKAEEFFSTGFLEVKMEVWFQDKDPSDDEE